MKVSCEIVRDLLPLYADDVLSRESRELVDGHLAECPQCGEYLKQIRSSEVEAGLKEERELVIARQARRFKRRSATAGAVIAALFMIPIMICLIVNLTTGRALDWFFVVVAAMAVAASLTVVPLMAPQDKLFWTFAAFCGSLLLLLAVTCVYTRGSWFFVAAGAALFGLGVVFLPFLIKARPLRRLVEGRNKAVLVIGLDFVLFANMMNMITLRSKSFLTTVMLALFCAGAVALLIEGKNRKDGNSK